jgi:hypothetical protein
VRATGTSAWTSASDAAVNSPFWPWGAVRAESILIDLIWEEETRLEAA